MTASPLENFSPFEKLLVDLARAGVDYAVAGGVAVSLNGFVRATDDGGHYSIETRFLARERSFGCGGASGNPDGLAEAIDSV